LGAVGTIVLALVLSLIIWVNAIYQNDRPREDYYPEALSIHVLDAPAGLVATNSPTESVRVRIRTYSSTWETLSSADFDVTSDWSHLDAGLHSVPVRVSCSNRTVSVLNVHPEMIYVRLEPTKQVRHAVSVTLLDQDAVPLGYSLASPRVTPEAVIVSGPESLVARVTRVTTSLSVANQTTGLERELEPVARDDKGTPVTGVAIDPRTVTVGVAIEKRENYREVAIRVRTKGQPLRGYYMSSLSVLPSSVTLVGPPDVVEKMGSLVDVSGEIDITDAARMVAARMTLSLPEDVSVVGERAGQPYEVLVTVGVDAVSGGTTVELPLRIRRLGFGLVALPSIESVDVILTGPAVLLDELQTDLLVAYVDLGGLGAGTHRLEPAVEIMVAQDSNLRALVVKDVLPQYVDVAVAEPTPTPTATPLPTEAPAASGTVAPTRRASPAPTARPTP
jgi:YbbR domain-containing protein